MTFLFVLMTSSDLNDAELLDRVVTGASSALKRDAQAAFYRRHEAYLLAVLGKRCRAMLELAHLSVEDLVQDTFERAFERARTFDAQSIVDPERLRRRTRAWLGTIAQHLLADSMAHAREIADSPLVEAAAEETRDEAPGWESPAVVAMSRALDALSEREQDVLRVTALYHRVGEQHQRLPNAVIAELAERWGTTGENVRAIRSRAMKKLRASLSGALKHAEDA